MKVIIGLKVDPTFDDEVLGDKLIASWFTSLGRFDRMLSCDITIEQAVTLVNTLKQAEGVTLVSPNIDYSL